MNKLFRYIKELLSQRKYGTLLVVLVIVVLIVSIFLPTSEPQNIQENIIRVNENVSNTAPGETILVGKTLSEAGTVFGRLLSSSQISQENKSQLFSAGRNYYPVEVITDNSNTIEAVRKPSLDFEKGELEKLKADNNLPSPDFEMYVLGGYYEKVYVFLSQGIAYEASEYSGAVYDRITFAPTDKEGFLNLFPGRYSEEYIPNLW